MSKNPVEKEPIPPMPEGFTDETAWMAIHHQFSQKGDGPSLLDELVISWQLDHQDRVQTAIQAEKKAKDNASHS